MKPSTPHLLVALGLLAWGWAFAQPPKLNLEFGGDVYISHVSVGLDDLASYRQHALSLTERLDTEGNVVRAQTEEGRSYVAASGDRSAFNRFDVAQDMTVHAATYIVAGSGYIVGGTGEELQCQSVPVEVATAAPLDTHVADATGFKSATLATAGETVNGVLADRYQLDPPEFAGRYDGGSLAGQLWLARDGGFIVKYEITAVDADGNTTRWLYDLTDVGTLSNVELPASCVGL